MIVKRNPHVVFSAIAEQKMCAFCIAGCENNSEVSMLGVVADPDTLKTLNSKKDRKADFWVLDFFPVKQEGNGAYTEMDPESVILLRQELVEKGYPSESQIVHFHTHPGMSTTPSAVDEKHIEAYDPDVALITVIMNEDYVLSKDRKGINVRLDIWYPFRRTFKDGEVDFTVEPVPLLPDSWGEDTFREYVSIIKPPVVKMDLKAKYPGVQKYFGQPIKRRRSTYLTLSHEELQEAYDHGDITEEQAKKLEFKLVNDPKYTEEDLIDDLYEDLCGSYYPDNWKFPHD